MYYKLFHPQLCLYGMGLAENFDYAYSLEQ